MKKKILISLALAIFVGSAGLVLAQEEEAVISELREKNEQKREEIKIRIETRRQKLLETKEQRKEAIAERVGDREKKKEERKIRNCENVEKQIQNRINRYQNSHNRHVKILGDMETKLLQIISKFKAKGLDVSELGNDAATLSIMTDSVIATHQKFLGVLKESKGNACDESDGEFKNKLENSRRILPEVKEGIEDIREYYKNTIRPDLLDLRRQLDDDDDDDDDDDEDGDDDDDDDDDETEGEDNE